MSKSRNHHIVTTALLLAVTACLAACGSLGEQTVKQTNTSINKTQSALMRAKKEVETTMVMLDILMSKNDPDLRKEYDQFDRHLSEAVKRKGKLSDCLYDMKSDGAEYFRVWEKELTSFRNDEIREQFESRHKDTLEEYHQMTLAVQASLDGMRILLGDLRDIRRYLDVDLTPGGVEAISDAVHKSTTDSTQLAKIMDYAMDSLEQMSADLSPQNGHHDPEELKKLAAANER